MYTAACRMIDFLEDKSFGKFEGCLFHQVTGIPLGTNCAPLLAGLFLHTYAGNFKQSDQSGHSRLARSLNLCHRYIDDLIVFNNKNFIDHVKRFTHLN